MMTQTIWLTGAAFVALCLFSAFFSGSETALTASSRARLLQAEKDGSKAARTANLLLQRRDRLIGSILLGNNVVNTLLAALATVFFAGLLGQGLGVAIGTTFTTIFLLVFGEIAPKTYAIANPEKLALRVAPLMRVIVMVFSPAVFAVQAVVRGAFALAGLKLDPEKDPFAAFDELRGAVELHHQDGAIVKDERDRIRGALELSELTVADVMVHRRSMRMLDASLPPREIIAQALAAQHTRLPLWRDSADNIVGILHAKDLLRALAASGADMDDVDVIALARQPWFVPETTRLQDQLDAFLRKRTHFALVVDEYGAIMGLVTLEDILEEIVGDIKDEHDVAVQGVRPQPDGSVNVDGWVPIRDLNRAMDWSLPDEEAVTVAGLIIHEAQAIPEVGQRFAFHGHRFQILRRNRNQITAIRVYPAES